MQVPNHDLRPFTQMLRLVADAEATRPMPEVSPRLTQWLESQLQIHAPKQRSWFDFLVTYSDSRRGSLRIAAAGALGGALLGGAGVAWLTRRPSPTQESIPRWVDAIAQYQSLYVRETVTGGATQSTSQAQTIVRAFTQSVQLPDFMIPDLSSHGLSFQRAQRLNFESIPLLQIVYLPTNGSPLALCAMPAKLLNLANTFAIGQPKQTASHGMSSSYWQQSGLAWVMVADWSPDKLQSLASQLHSKV